MGKSKYSCAKCGQKHYPPTGKKCNQSLMSSPDPKDSVSVGKGKKKQTSKSHMSEDGGLNCNSNSCGSLPTVLAALDRSGLQSSEASSEASSGDEGTDQASTALQSQILKELQRVNARLDAVEDRVAAGHQQAAAQGHKDFKLSTSKCSRKESKRVVVTSDSSSDESDIPDISSLRSSRELQKKVDHRLSKLEKSSVSQGKSGSKIKSKRGGEVEVLVENKVAWPHESIFGGVNRQRISYDQLSLTQFVQGFVRNILDESDQNCREQMLVKRPARDACLCMGELPAPPAPAAPHFVFLITL